MISNEFDLIYVINRLKKKVEQGGDWESDLGKQDSYFNIFKSLMFISNVILKPDGFTARNGVVVQDRKRSDEMGDEGAGGFRQLVLNEEKVEADKEFQEHVLIMKKKIKDGMKRKVEKIRVEEESKQRISKER